MRDIEQHDLEVAQKQELKEIQGHHFGGLSRKSWLVCMAVE